MKIWLPYVRGGSGVDVYTKLLERGLRDEGHEAIAQEFNHNAQYAPFLLSSAPPPNGTDLILANSWNGFAFHRQPIPLVIVEHHCVFDRAYAPYRNRAQAFFHQTLVRRYERKSFASADAVVAVSNYTARSTKEAFPNVDAHVILNGVDTDFFCPEEDATRDGKTFRLLFVGNLTERKGADLLEPIMRELGAGFELRYTLGLRASDPFAGAPNMHSMGRLTDDALRQAYRDADALLFPTRLEGFGYAAAEAMACGTPVIATDCSAIPEVVESGRTGMLCARDDIKDFAQAARTLRTDLKFLQCMRATARNQALDRFNLPSMSAEYVKLFSALLNRRNAPTS